MLTEWYSLAFFGLDTEYYTDDYVAYLWEISANKEYKRSNIYITARIATEFLVSGRIRADLGTVVYVITSVRNPAEIESKEDYWDAYRNVVNEVRTNFGNPNMTISTHSIDYYFFYNV